MRLFARCRVCEREFLLVMMVPPEGTAGRCPFCGVKYDVPVDELGEAVRAVESLAGGFVHALRRLIEMHPGLDIDVEAALRLVAPPGDDRAPQPPTNGPARPPDERWITPGIPAGDD